MFTWINHNSLYILIFIFPFVISTFTYFYISKNRLFILLIFISLTAFFILVRLIFAPQEPSQQEKIELSSSLIQPVKEIKSLGVFKVILNLHSEIQSQISIKVISQENTK